MIDRMAGRRVEREPARLSMASAPGETLASCATVLTAPAGVNLRMAWLFVSATKRLPCASRAIPAGPSKRASKGWATPAASIGESAKYAGGRYWPTPGVDR